jgi:nitroimidazol reductase NimA-like FMN-containing flavoprotein (pyridoxamine 5'-phosphate oxidase superfamily)
MNTDPTPELDNRFSDPEAVPTPWAVTVAALERAELYWITTVRPSGRPHVTPLVGVADDGAVYFCTGLEEQKARNLEQNEHVAITTGNNTWASGLDVIVEGTAVRVSDSESLRRLADAYLAKYGSDWRFGVGDGVLTHGEEAEHEAALFRVEPGKVLAFAKDPHAQTRYRLR